MDDFHENRDAVSDGGPAGGLPERLLKLLQLLLADAASDVEVVARELGLSDAMRERLRRALDQLVCAQSTLEALHGGIPCNEGLPITPARQAVETLASTWPRDYTADVVEWLLLDER
ncbi:hypothetical protein QCE73_37145 [Caballeronia sp. LZ029]|uniref:hypothetical protein n=1 Tax=Caballeronia sp. LZ029 TaxID=3038564 RepID=UPI002864A378|nr:hypothetical protein [Caballeronia sp. LZ029]MDR5748810.1 hypothetical protein [Caballeronia sp. LZ029]